MVDDDDGDGDVDNDIGDDNNNGNDDNRRNDDNVFNCNCDQANHDDDNDAITTDNDEKNTENALQ